MLCGRCLERKEQMTALFRFPQNILRPEPAEIIEPPGIAAHHHAALLEEAVMRKHDAPQKRTLNEFDFSWLVQFSSPRNKLFWTRCHRSKGLRFSNYRYNFPGPEPAEIAALLGEAVMRNHEAQDSNISSQLQFIISISTVRTNPWENLKDNHAIVGGLSELLKYTNTKTIRTIIADSPAPEKWYLWRSRRAASNLASLNLCRSERGATWTL